MKPFVRTIFIWFLSLSLTGLPVAALSQDITDLNPAEKNMSEQKPAEKAAEKAESAQNNTEHCHSGVMSSADDLSKTASKPAMSASTSDTSADTSADTLGKCCCDGDCQCQSDMACQVSHFSSTSAILQSNLYISSPLSSQLIIELAVLYFNCDTDSEKIPPIV